MSFTADVKLELCSKRGKGRHCEIAELAAIINGCCKLFYQNPEDVGAPVPGATVSIEAQTESPIVARRFMEIARRAFSAAAGPRADDDGKNPRKRRRAVIGAAYCEKILSATGLLYTEDGVTRIEKRVSEMVTKAPCCKRAYIRGAFIACGSVAEPEKPYHLEFICENPHLAKRLCDLISFFEISPKTIVRGGRYVIYIKEGEQIADLMNIMEAHASLLEFENKRVFKSVRNKVNREFNCEIANMGKTACAAVRQIKDIEFIIGAKGFNYLPDQLAEVAEARLDNPEASLKEISAMLKNPVGKSGVNHRFRKISQIAENLMIDAD